jgi:hypothetical protein
MHKIHSNEAVLESEASNKDNFIRSGSDHDEVVVFNETEGYFRPVVIETGDHIEVKDFEDDGE